MTFEYLQRIVVDAQLEVEDIGQCVILGRNDLGEEYYLITRTEMGFTEQILFGPVCPEVSILPFNVSMYYNRFEFNQRKIESSIDKFLNDTKKAISQADVVTIEEIQPQVMQSINKIFKVDKGDSDDEGNSIDS